MSTIERKPKWLRISFRTDENIRRVYELLSRLSLNTVCQEARCPNIFECFAAKTATFMVLGDVCTRHCGFCSVDKGNPLPLDCNEPARVAEAVAELELDYVVVTSVNRDDLPDEGSLHFARTIAAVKERVPDCRVEVLIPDFHGKMNLLTNVLAAGPDVLAHNVETVPQLYSRVRPGSVYSRSLDLLARAVEYRRRQGRQFKVKTGLMVGLGEEMHQVLSTMEDIASTGCDLLTLGQYLQPQKRALPVVRYYRPWQFAFMRRQGLAMGFEHVEAGPLVRSSYHAKEQTS